MVIDGDQVHATFRPFHQVEWSDIFISDLQEIHDASALERHVKEHFDKMSGTISDENRMVRIVLSGATPLASDLVRDEYLADLEAELRVRLGVLDLSVQCRGIMPPVDLEQYRDQQHVLGEVLQLIDALADDDKLLRELAPDPIAGTEFAGEDTGLYLRELAANLAPEAAARLLGEDQ